jgi:hypothetical protein
MTIERDYLLQFVNVRIDGNNYSYWGILSPMESPIK